MNAAASKIVSEGFLKGFFGTIDLMLSSSSTFEVRSTDDLSPDDWGDYIPRYSAGLQAKVKGGGAFVLLLAASDVNNVASVFNGEEPQPKPALAPESLPALKEVFEPCLGGGASFFKEAFGNSVDLEDCEVFPFGIDNAESLTDVLGDAVTTAPFKFKVPDAADGNGVLLFTQNIEKSVPEKAVAEAQAQQGGAPARGPQLSQEELDDILGGVGAPPPKPTPIAAAIAAAAPPPPQTPIPSNIDMVLDIRLVATARLGRVEMPIADILSLGPGSIIEVGHLVDEPIELLVNDKLIARGDVVVVEEKFGLRITEIVSTKERIESLR